MLGAWCGLLVNSLVIDTLHWRHLWIVAALIWAGSMRRYRQGTPLPVRLLSLGVSVLIAASLLLIPVRDQHDPLAPLPAERVVQALFPQARRLHQVI